MNDTRHYRLEIITGRYPSANQAQQQMLRRLLGEHAEADFEIYFHWYNLIHELGHAILFFHSDTRPHPAEEEQMVNDFAFAYWRHYGEPEKIAALSSIVSHSLERFVSPAKEGVGYLEYAKSVWGKEELYSFNNYGWFQFSCVQRAIAAPISLKQALTNMGVSGIQPQPGITLRYHTDQSMPSRVLDDAVKQLSAWGIALPKTIKLTMSNDPNCHMCRTEKIDI